jgi:hypothetical protein
MLPLCSRVRADLVVATLAGLQAFAPKCRALAGGIALAARTCVVVHAAATYGGGSVAIYVRGTSAAVAPSSTEGNRRRRTAPRS